VPPLLNAKVAGWLAVPKTSKLAPLGLVSPPRVAVVAALRPVLPICVAPAFASVPPIIRLPPPSKVPALTSSVPLLVRFPVSVAEPVPVILHAPGLLTVTDPIVMALVNVGSPVAIVASKVLPAPLFGKVLLQLDQSATVVQLAVASFHEQVKLVACAGTPAPIRPRAIIATPDSVRKTMCQPPPPRAGRRPSPAIGAPARRSRPLPGNYSQSGGTFDAPLHRTGVQIDMVDVTAGHAVTLTGGDLEPSGITFAAGQEFDDIMKFQPGELTGTFATILAGGNGVSVNLGNGLMLEAIYDNAGGDISLKVEPAIVPAPLIGGGFPAFLAVSGLLLGAKLRERGKKRRSLGTTPHA